MRLSPAIKRCFFSNYMDRETISKATCLRFKQMDFLQTCKDPCPEWKKHRCNRNLYLMAQLLPGSKCSVIQMTIFQMLTAVKILLVNLGVIV
jgi:hypothetical protein